MSKKKLIIILTYIKRAIKCTGNDISKVREIPKIESRESRDLVIERHERISALGGQRKNSWE